MRCKVAFTAQLPSQVAEGYGQYHEGLCVTVGAHCLLEVKLGSNAALAPPPICGHAAFTGRIWVPGEIRALHMSYAQNSQLDVG